MPTDSFFDALRAENADVHHRGLHHPAVLGIGDGSLPESTFRYYIEQDYQFLRRYVRAIAHAVVASDDLPTAARLAELLHSTLAVEIDALVGLYAAFGGQPEALDGTEPVPTCQAYTDHLLASAARGDLLITFASILPCQWGYREIGRHLRARGLPDDERFGRWIEEYASDEYGALVDWIVARFDDLARSSGETALAEARRAFRLSTRYELAFWEMAWTRQSW